MPSRRAASVVGGSDFSERPDGLGVERAAEGVLESRPQAGVARPLTLSLVQVQLRLLPSQLLGEEDRRPAEPGADLEDAARHRDGAQHVLKRDELTPAASVLVGLPVRPRSFVPAQAMMWSDQPHCPDVLPGQRWDPDNSLKFGEFGGERFQIRSQPRHDGILATVLPRTTQHSQQTQSGTRRRESTSRTTRSGVSSRVRRDTFQIESVELPGWHPDSGRIPGVGESVRCVEGEAEVVRVLGKVSDGSRLLELRLAAIDSLDRHTEMPIIPLRLKRATLPAANEITSFETSATMPRKARTLTLSLFDPIAGKVLLATSEIEP